MGLTGVTGLRAEVTDQLTAAPPQCKADVLHCGGWSPHGYEGGGSGRSHPENADPDQQVAKRMKLSTPY